MKKELNFIVLIASNYSKNMSMNLKIIIYGQSVMQLFMIIIFRIKIIFPPRIYRYSRISEFKITE